MNVFLNMMSETFSNYRMIIAMDNASWHIENNNIENIVPLFQPPHIGEEEFCLLLTDKGSLWKEKLEMLNPSPNISVMEKVWEFILILPTNIHNSEAGL